MNTATDPPYRVVPMLGLLSRCVNGTFGLLRGLRSSRPPAVSAIYVLIDSTVFRSVALLERHAFATFDAELDRAVEGFRLAHVVRHALQEMVELLHHPASALDALVVIVQEDPSSPFEFASGEGIPLIGQRAREKR